MPAGSESPATRRTRRLGGPRTARVVHEDTVGVSAVQRSRMLNSAVQVVMEEGYGQMSVARVTGRAGVSRRTFYELFEDREACFLAAFDQAVHEMESLAAEGWAAETLWREQVRAALALLLGFLDERPGVGSLVIVEALGAGPRVLKHRARTLKQLATLVDEGRRHAAPRHRPPPLTAEGVVGAVFSVIHARLLDNPEAPLAGLLNPLMSVIVGPYLGQAAATRELERPAAHSAPRRVAAANPLEGLNMRITSRTLQTLTAIARGPGASNRQIADEVGITDQGQISKLLTRLESLGLIHNRVPGQPTGEPNEWHLTPQGQGVQQAISVRSGAEYRRTNATKEPL